MSVLTRNLFLVKRENNFKLLHYESVFSDVFYTLKILKKTEIVVTSMTLFGSLISDFKTLAHVLKKQRVKIALYENNGRFKILVDHVTFVWRIKYHLSCFQTCSMFTCRRVYRVSIQISLIRCLIGLTLCLSNWDQSRLNWRMNVKILKVFSTL